MNRWTRCTFLLLLVFALAGSTLAVEPPQRNANKSFQHPDLNGQDFFGDARMQGKAGVALLDKLGTPNVGAYIDLRSGRLASYMPSTPMIPGKGVGNNLRWNDFNKAGKPDTHGQEQAAWQAVRNYLRNNSEALGIDVSELAQSPRITSYEGGEMIHIHAPRVIDGYPVRDSFVKATVKYGNLILLNTHKWSDRGAGADSFQISAASAEAIADARLGNVTGTWGKTEPLFITLYNGKAPNGSEGYRYTAVYSVKRYADNEVASWEVLVDARTGKLVEVADRNEYAEVVGGVLPVTNDGINPDGVEQAGWPMPFADVGGETTDTGGNFSATGTVSTDLYGPYVNINDNCGSSSLSGSGVLDWGTSGGTDCTTPGFGGAGNTHASRTGFYELNKIIEMARGQLPSNSWLTQRLTSNMNINSTCNAFWNGTVNFYRSGGGCSNTGEIAGVFDHEWGHGMDANDATPGIASPSGEGIADIYTALRLDSSCIGRNFRSTTCSSGGKTCNTCTGVRDIDYLKKTPATPSDFTWRNANCGSSVHCTGHVYSEAVWSLWKRELPGTYGYDNNTAHEIVNRLTFIGAGNTGTWFSGSPPEGGCSGGSGYQNYLAADDDNGNLNDGTPHMAAIFKAFDDQEIACSTPTVQDSGCSGVPTTAPSVNGTASDKTVDLSWGAVSGATSYEVFRTEGVFQCDFGKVKIAEITGTNISDTGLQNGREYSYVVIPKAGDACFGPASSCTSVSPAAGPGLTVDSGSASTNVSGGDGDAYLDNCENGTTTFDVINSGLGSLTNVRITAITPSNGGVTVNTALPATISASLGQGNTAQGSFSYTAGGLTHGETLTFTVTVTADELAAAKNADVSVADTETDLTFISSVTYDFESGNDGWTTLQGTFGRSNSGGGAGGSTWYEQSSANLDNQCDQIQSPTLVFSSTTTLSLSTNYDIEPFYNQSSSWYDRANVGLVVGGSRSVVSPDSGRTYNASGSNGNCGTTGQPGWADAATSWGSSSFSAGALGSAGLAGQSVTLDIRYGTDGSLNGYGFRFDQVTLTNVSTLGPDAQSDSCGCNVDADCNDGQFCNGTETCNNGTCQAGTPVVCDDGVSCTVDTCNEGGDVCDFTPDDSACQNGAFCDGAETCDAIAGCQAGTPPICVFGCDEAGDVCFECSANGDCDDGLFCNGVETCNGGSCSAGTNPCSGECDEANDECISCAPAGASCTANSDCCGNKCRGKSGAKTCK